MHLSRRARALIVGVAVAGGTIVSVAPPASAISVSTEAGLRAAFADGAESSIVLTADIDLVDCGAGDLNRPAGASALTVSGAFEIHQTCPTQRVLSADGATGALVLEDVTISGGRLTGDPSASGGGIQWSGDVTLDGVTVTDNTVTAPISALGGGLFITGELVVSDSVISGNTAASNGDFGALGGAFSSSGEALVIDSTLSGNIAEGGVEFAGTGGAVFGNSDVTIIGSTISGNQALGSGDGTRGGNGGGVVLNAALSLYNTTVTGNSAIGATSNNGGVASGGDMTLVYSTITGNAAATSANVQSLSDDSDFSVDLVFATVISNPLGGGTNCGPGSAAVSEGYSFADDTSCNLTATGDQQGTTDPQLGSLGDNGGGTATQLPAATSPLVDAIPAASCQAGPAVAVDDDQRGIARPQGDACDIGAVEVAAIDPTTPTPTPTPTPGAAQPVAGDPRYTG